MDTAQRGHDARIAELESANQSLQQKFDASFEAQGNMEDQMEAANDLIDRLRHNLDDVDRQLRQQQRRYADQVSWACQSGNSHLQEKAFEAERMVHQAEQNHLVQRIKSLTTERIARPSEDEGDRSAATVALQEELVTLSASHQTLVAQLTTLADEMHEVKAENSRLQEENESWQLLIEERTLAGHMRGGLIPGPSTSPSPEGAITPSSIRRKEPSALETLEEQLEMDELHSELDAQQPIFEESDRALLRVTSGGSYVDLSSPPRSNGASLASELGAGISMAEIESLRNEIKTLKEANKALSLYCSKILDRIIAAEGYEHILSVDYRTRRGTRSQPNGKPRPSVIELAKDMEENGPPPIPESLPPAPSKSTSPPPPAPRETPAPRARPQSMYVASSVATPTPVPATGPTKSPVNGASGPERKDSGDKEKDKRAKRGFSIDFRSLGFGAQEKPETKPQLKPLQLASRAAPAGQSPPKSQASPIVALGPSAPQVPGARKLAPQEEDEEDRRERSRMEANLKLMGIVPPVVTSPSSEPNGLLDDKPASASAASSPASAAAGWLSRRLSRPSVPTPATPTTMPSPEIGQRGSTTPLARLSAALSDSSRPELDAAQDPESALRAYDAREREQARLLAEGKSPTAFTAPPKIVRRNRSSAGSTLSRNSAQSGTASAMGTSVGSAGSIHGEVIAEKPQGQTLREEREPLKEAGVNGQAGANASHHRARESVSTLWSMGSSHDQE